LKRLPQEFEIVICLCFLVVAKGILLAKTKTGHQTQICDRFLGRAEATTILFFVLRALFEKTISTHGE